jgi:hypothetical protein
MDTEKKPVRSRTSKMVIGKVTYIVTTHLNENGRETIDDKLFRLVTSHMNNETKKPTNAVI